MDSKISRGDVVWLKSGGPSMTVLQTKPVKFSEGDYLLCSTVWFLDGEAHAEDFADYTLTRNSPY